MTKKERLFRRVAVDCQLSVCNVVLTLLLIYYSAVAVKMILVIALSVLMGVLSLYYYLRKNYDFFKKRGVPYLEFVPLLGNMAPVIFYTKTITELVKSLYDAYPDAKYTGMFDLLTPIITLRDPELIKLISVKHFDVFAEHRSFVDERQDPLFGKNLFSLRAERWREVRTILSPAFTSSKMKNMFKLMTECGANFANYLMQLPPEKRVMEIKDAFTKYTNDVIATCAFGVKVDSMRYPKNEFYTYGKEATNFSGIVFLKFYIIRTFPWLARLLQLRLIRTKVADFFQDLIENTIKTRDEKGIVRPDMLQLMMENRNKDGKTTLSIQDMVSQAFIFFFGGFDSTATLMCFTAHEIAVNQDVQERLQKEIDQVLKDTNGEAPYEAINGMEYLEAVIYETLRRYPVAPMIDRLCLKDFELPPAIPGMKPLTIKKGQILNLPIYGLHHDPKYFKEPERFDPERFLGERKKENINCGAYIPFGMGPRMCIGNRFALLETKVLLFHLLARCDLKPCDKTTIPLKLAKGGFNMKAANGFWLNVVPRKNPHCTVLVNSEDGTRRL